MMIIIIIIIKRIKKIIIMIKIKIIKMIVVIMINLKTYLINKDSFQRSLSCVIIRFLYS